MLSKIGQDVIEDAEALKVIAADQLDIDGFAFSEVVSLLEDIGAIYNVQRQGGGSKDFMNVFRSITMSLRT